jgi:hypothetical protein
VVRVTDVNKTLKDAAYVAVGFGVLGFQKAQVRRQELKKQVLSQRAQVESQLEGAVGQLSGLVKTLDERLRPVRQELEGRLDTFEGRLPDPAKELVKRARILTKDTEDQVRKLVGVA